MNRRRLLERLRNGHLHNVSFDDFCALVEGLGYQLDRTTGSHRAYVHRQLGLLLSLQPLRGEAKPYQIRELLRDVERYNLRLEGEP